MRWLNGLNGHEFEQTPGDSEGQGSLACCSPWDRKVSDMTEQLNNTYNNKHSTYFSIFHICGDSFSVKPESEGLVTDDWSNV